MKNYLCTGRQIVYLRSDLKAPHRSTAADTSSILYIKKNNRQMCAAAATTKNQNTKITMGGQKKLFFHLMMRSLRLEFDERRRPVV